jgi:ribosomal RNA-processing protein 7
MAPQPTTISSFTTLPLLLPPTPSYLTKNATHTLYIRPNAPKIPQEADSRSLFLVNVPVDATVAHLKGVFAGLVGSKGRVEDVIFEGEKPKTSTAVAVREKGVGKKRKRGEVVEDEVGDIELPNIWGRETRKSGGSAVVVFVDVKSMEGVLKAVRKLHKSSNSKQERKYPVWGEGIANVPAMGSSRYASHHALRFPEPGTLQHNVDAFMTAFNLNETHRQREATRARNVPDADGFITVTRGGRVGPAKAEEAEKKRKEMEEREKERTGEGFYRFQVREKRKMEQGELVRRFEEDRRRVEGMRERRGKGGFRPES